MKFELPLPTRKMLEDDAFCSREERNFFESKFLGQVSEIAELRKELANSKKEISRLRGELMEATDNVPTTTRSMSFPPSVLFSPKDTVEGKTSEQDDCRCISDDSSSLTDDIDDTCGNELDKDDNFSDDEDSKKSANELRRSAHELLKWANFRSSSNNTVQTSPTSTISTPIQSSITQTINKTVNVSVVDGNVVED